MNASSRRSGTAPIEFVLVLPLLLFLCVGLFLMSRATIAKEAAATRARRDAWAKRPEAKPGDIFLLSHDPAESRVQAATRIRVAGGPLFRRTNFEAESQAAVIDAPWHHRSVPFDALGDFKVHRKPFKLIAKNLTFGDLVVGATQLFADLLNPGLNPLMVAAATVGKLGNVAVAVAGKVLVTIISPILGGVIATIQLAMVPLRLASWFSLGARRLLRRLVNAVNLIRLGLDAGYNLDRAANGLPVGEPFGFNRLFVP